MSVSSVADLEGARVGGVKHSGRGYKKAFFWTLAFLVAFFSAWVVCLVILLVRDANGYGCPTCSVVQPVIPSSPTSVSEVDNTSGTSRIRGNLLPYPNAITQGTSDVAMNVPTLTLGGVWSQYVSEIDPNVDNPISDFNIYVASLGCSGKATTTMSFSSPTIKTAPYYLSNNNYANFVATGGPEQYTLSVAVNGDVSIQAETYIGVGYALSTLQQYIEAGPNGCLFRQLPLTITDNSNTFHRDVMLDTGRNFYSTASILRLLKQMGTHKLNFLSWHITENQSFPLSVGPVTSLLSETPSTDPNFYNMTGAFSSTSIYTKSDVGTIIRTARNYGISVEPGIDSPGHCSSFMYGSLAATKLLTGTAVQIIKYWELNFQGDTNAPEPIIGYFDIVEPTVLDAVITVMQAVFEEIYDAFEMGSGLYGKRVNLNADELSSAIVPLTETYIYLNRLLDIFDPTVSKSTKDWSGVNIAMWIDVVANGLTDLTDSTSPNYLSLKRFDGQLTLQLWNLWPSASIGLLDQIFTVLPKSEAVNFNSNYYYMDAGYPGQMWGGHSFDLTGTPDVSQALNVYWVSANPTLSNQWLGTGTGRGWQVSPKKIYTYNFLWDWTGASPATTSTTLSQGAVKLVNTVGAGIAVWSETIASGNLDSKIVSNMAALGEVTWKYNEEHAPDNLPHFDYRMHYHLKQLQQAPYLVSTAVMSYSGANFERQFPQGNLMNEDYALGANGDIDQMYLDSHFPTWNIQIRSDHVGCVNNNLLVNINPTGPLGYKAISQYPLSARFVYSDVNPASTYNRVNPWLMNDLAALVADPTTAKIGRSNFASTSAFYANSGFFMDQRDSPIVMTSI